MRLSRVFLGTFALGVCLVNLYAQDSVQSNLPGAGFDTPDADALAAPTLHVYSRETIVDVLVADAQGRPVRGLKRSDFTVSEDDKPEPIRGFSEFDREAPAVATAPLPANTYSNGRALPASGPVQIFYINLPCPPLNPERAESSIADYLRTMPAGTQVAVFGFRSDLGLRLVQGFTTDGPRAASSIDNLALPVCKAPSADPIAAANQIAAYVAGIHGRKNLIWLGNPLDIMRDGGMSWHPGGPPDMTYVHRLMDTYDRFAAEQIAVYPFDPGGVRLRGLGGAFELLRKDEIAAGTGGAAIYNTNDFRSAAAKIVADTSQYYTLSYVPPRLTDDGHYHPIKISVDRPGVHLTYRGGYNSEQPPPPDAVLKVQMTQNTMGLGALPATELVFDVKVAPSLAAGGQPAGDAPARKSLALAGKRPVAYDMLFTLEPGQIAFAEGADQTTFSGALEFDAAAYDSYGKAVAFRSQTMKLPLTLEEHRDFIEAPFKFFLPIDLPPGQVTLRVGVFDAVSGKAGTLEVPVSVGRVARVSAGR
jgi:VWFA-related protein